MSAELLTADVAGAPATRAAAPKSRWLFSPRADVCVFGGSALVSLALLVSDARFWRALAYLAVFHFVRQQYGWVAMYRARAGERGRTGWLIDSAAVYMATLYPLAYWHSHLPRRFWWFLPGDFAQLPAWVERVAFPFYCLALGAYGVRSLRAWVVRGEGHPGKDIVVATTAVCWYAG